MCLGWIIIDQLKSYPAAKGEVMAGVEHRQSPSMKDFPAQEEHDVAQLIVRNVDPEVVHRLKLRAAPHGRSMEAEHREILRQALLTSEPGVTLKTLVLAMPPMGDDTDFARLPDQERAVEL